MKKKKEENTILTEDGLISIDDVKKEKYRLFPLDEKAIKKYEKWYKKQPKQDYGAGGGGVEFIFIPTGLGMIIKARYNNKEIDLTDFGNW